MEFGVVMKETCSGNARKAHRVARVSGRYIPRGIENNGNANPTMF